MDYVEELLGESVGTLTAGWTAARYTKEKVRQQPQIRRLSVHRFARDVVFALIAKGFSARTRHQNELAIWPSIDPGVTPALNDVKRERERK